MKTPRVQVLLSTFNGVKYLPQLLDSLEDQEHSHLEILIRDDGSTDSTTDCLKNYASKRDNVQIIYGENLGFAKSYLKLLTLADRTVDYLAFCDQDDIWQPDKISRAVRILSQYPSEIPTLYASRLKVVNENLQELGYSPIPRKGLSFYNAMVECPFAGCTMLINQSGYQLLREFPQYVYSHDWWIYLVISAFGNVIYDPDTKILYRQHSANVFGLKLTTLSSLKTKIKRFFTEGKYHPVVKQIRGFKNIYGDLIYEEYYRELNKIIDINQIWFRLLYVFIAKVYRQNNFDNLILKIILLVNRL